MTESQQPGGAPPGPLYVVGSSRSGTTMVGRILGRHPRVHTFGELHFFEQLWDPSQAGTPANEEQRVELVARLMGIEESGYLRATVVTDANRQRARALLEGRAAVTLPDAYFAFLAGYAAEQGCTVACEQTPRNALYLDEILELAPEARVLVLERDPRDVLLSQKHKWRRRRLGGARSIPVREAIRAWINYHPATIAHLWRASIRSARRHAQHPRVHFVRFEELIGSPAETIRDVCAFCGLAFSDDLLNVPRIGSSTKADSDERGIDPTRAQGWRAGGLSRVELALCERITRAELEALGYESSGNRLPLLGGALSLGLLVPKLGLALLVNLRRTRNLASSLRRRLR